MRTYRYIGNFPPPYGGVTIKNQLLFTELSKKISIRRVVQKKWMPKKFYQLINCILSMVPGQALIIGISGAGGTSLLQTKLLYCLNRRTMQHSLYFMMGGQEAKRIASSPSQIKMYGTYRKIYVEIPSMQRQLQNAGLNNVNVFPNCRKRLSETSGHVLQSGNSVVSTDSQRLKVVFFSLISPEKGIDIVIATASLLQNMEFHLYGEIKNGYKEEFLESIAKLSNTVYHGVYKGKDAQVYHVLSKYDVLLFPSRWKNEGVPGILVESKIVGLPAIVSDIAYNTEIVNDGVDGIVLKENTVECLSQALSYLDENRNILSNLKAGAKNSSEHYCIDNYVGEIIGELKK